MPASTHTGSGDDELRELVIDVLERLDRGATGALEEACRARPELAQRLRARVDALRELGLVGAGAQAERVGDFRLLERIGAGGMGVVYRAEQAGLGREVALKLIRPEILGFARARERFERETAIVARLQHPSIVPIYTVGRDAERPYYAMELVRGCTLEQALGELEGRAVRELRGADLLAAVRARSPAAAQGDDGESYLFEGTWEQVALRVTALIADALDHAHRRGVLHRDVKPGNVLITPGGRVMLVDFGLSQSTGDDSLTRSGERVGSVHYMPPELLRGGAEELDRRSDVYSLGVTLYRMLTLERPFGGANEATVMQAVLEGRPRPPRELAPSLSWEAETVCLAAMDRDPERRYPTAAAFARDLANALDRRPVEARRAGFLLRARRWVERRPGEAAALALALALVVAVPSLIAWFQAREARRSEQALLDVRAEETRTEEQRRLAVEQGERAEQNYALALDTVDTLLRRVGEERLDRIPGMLELRGELATAAELAYARLREADPTEVELVRLTAGSRRLRALTLEQQGRRAEAVALLEASVGELEPLLETGEFELRRMHALCLQELASLRNTPAELARCLGTLRALLVERPDDPELRALLLRAVRSDAIFERHAGDPAGALQSIARTEREARALLEAAPGADARLALALALDVHARVLWNEGRLTEARPRYEESLEHFREVQSEDSGRDEVRAGLADTASELGALLAQLGYDEDSLFLLDEAEPELEHLARAYPGHTGYALNLADLHKNRGITLGKLGRSQESETALRLALAEFAALERRAPERGSLGFERGIAGANLAMNLSKRGDIEGALGVLDAARDDILAAHQAKPGDDTLASWIGVERLSRASILLKVPRPADAAEVLADAPRLVRHRVDRVDEVLQRLALCLDLAREAGDEPMLLRTERAVRLGLAAAEQRGDCAHLPSLRALREKLELP